MRHLGPGLATGTKAGIVIVLALLVLGATYLELPLITGGTSSSSQTSLSSSASSGRGGSTSILQLFGAFSQMQVVEATYDNSEGHALDEQHTVSYQVLGKATLNSVQYTKVKLTQSESTSAVIAWFNPQGGIDRVDVLGVQNYTGSGASLYAQLYTSIVSGTSAISNNATLISLLSRTAQNTTTIGSVQLSTTTYSLPKALAPYDAFTIRLATIPGTNTTFTVYFDIATSDQLETVFQVLTLTK